ncbi:MAG: response regulator [Pseudomonadota bacterium]
MKTCLVVDDSSVIRKVAKRIIEDLGHRFEDAADGEEALLRCRDRLPDAIIVDWQMPGMNGVEFIKAFKEKYADQSKNMPIMFCTSEMDVPAMTQAKRAGASHFLMKPLDAKVVGQKLREAGLMSEPSFA